MASWSDDDMSCVMTWITLALLNESQKSFVRTETVKMRSLAFWVAGSSPELREARARSLATQMDAMFIQVAKAKYENGVKQQQAVFDMLSVLTQGDLTVPDLAEANDANYYFTGEKPKP